MNNIEFERSAIDSGECISGAWTLVTRRFWMYIGLGLVTMVFLACIPFVGFFLFGPIFGGFYYFVLRDMRDESVDFGMLFKGFEKFLPLMIAGLVQSAPSLVATVIQYTVDFARLAGTLGGRDINFYQSPGDVFAGISAAIVVVVVLLTLIGIVWSIALSFAVPLILEHDLPVVEALTLSVKASAGNAGGLVILLILQLLVAILGLVALCVGILVAIPVVYAANAFAYRMVFPYFDRPNFNTAPPSPDAYNFGGGQ